MPEEPTRTLGEQIRNLRAMRGESLRAVADATGYSTAYLQKLEKGDVKGPSPHLLQALARHFAVSYLSLMDMAGYATEDAEKSKRRRLSPVAEAIISEDFSAAEQRAIAAFVASLKAGRPE